MLESFKLGYGITLGVVAAVITGLVVLGLYDWLAGIATRIRLALFDRGGARGPMS